MYHMRCVLTACALTLPIESITLEPQMEVEERPGTAGLGPFATIVCIVTPVNATVAVRWTLPNGTMLNEGSSGRFFVDQGAETGELTVILVITTQLSYQDAGDYTCEVMEPGAEWIPATVELQLTGEYTFQIVENEKEYIVA